MVRKSRVWDLRSASKNPATMAHALSLFAKIATNTRTSVARRGLLRWLDGI